MSKPTLPSPADAAETAGVRIVPLDDMGLVGAAADLIDRVWATTDLMRTNLIRAVEQAGGYAVGALDRASGELVGTTVAFLGSHEVDGQRQPTLHSHITCTDVRSRGVGLALKVHQREWCAARGIVAVTWTFDPLVARNAWFNLGKLGATGRQYLVNHYGAMDDAINAGDESDRLLAWWPSGVGNSAGQAGPLGADGSAAADLAAVRLLDVGTAGEPVLSPVRVDAASVLLEVRVPPDIEATRRRDPDLARRWRTAVRETMGQAMACGHRATGMRRDGTYLLTPAEAVVEGMGR